MREAGQNRSLLTGLPTGSGRIALCFGTAEMNSELAADGSDREFAIQEKSPDFLKSDRARHSSPAGLHRGLRFAILASRTRLALLPYLTLPARNSRLEAS